MKDIRLESYAGGSKSITVEGYCNSVPLTPQTEIMWYSQSGNIANMPQLKKENSKRLLYLMIRDIMLADSQDFVGEEYQIKCIITDEESEGKK